MGAWWSKYKMVPAGARARLMYVALVAVALAVIGLILTSCSSGVSAPISMTQVRGVAVYRIDATLGRGAAASVLASTLPAIKGARLNAVMIPAVWADFDPKPLATPHQYNAVAFAAAKAALAKARAEGVLVLVGLNYIGEGFAPDLGGVAACDWAVNPVTYAAFERYVKYWLTEMLPWADVLRPFVFTEGAEGCGKGNQAQGPAVALALQGTLGSLPKRLPGLLRGVYQLGYHDYTLLTLGWGAGASPIAGQPFDWLSMVAYNVGTVAELDARLSRWRGLYPTTPLVVGELGANGCGVGGEARQAGMDTLGAKWALEHGLGFSVWGWINAGAAECTNPVYGGLAITNPDGSLRQAAAQIKALLP